MFKFYDDEEFEIRKENLIENINSDEFVTDVNNVDAGFDEALLFF